MTGFTERLHISLVVSLKPSQTPLNLSNPFKPISNPFKPISNLSNPLKPLQTLSNPFKPSQTLSNPFEPHLKPYQLPFNLLYNPKNPLVPIIFMTIKPTNLLIPNFLDFGSSRIDGIESRNVPYSLKSTKPF